MTAQSKTVLKGYFNTGDIPSEANFANLIDTLGMPGIVVAAVGATDADKGKADIVCDGVHDEDDVQAAHNALPATGGLVKLVGPTFTFDTNTLTWSKAGAWLRGQGRNATRINVTGLQDGITVDVGVDGTYTYMNLSDFWMQLPLANSGNGIALLHERTNVITIERLKFSGGSALAWAILSNGTNIAKISNIVMPIHCNGILYQCVPDTTNYGDSLLQMIDIMLGGNNLTGIKLVGPDASIRLVNNVEINKVEITGTGPAGGDVGIHVRNASRNSLVHIDLENLGTGVLYESGQGGGVVSEANAFIQIFPLNCGADYTEVGVPTHTTVVGGDGAFQTIQQLAGNAFP